MTKTIRCITLAGDTIEIPVNQIQERPAAYGFIVHDSKLLLYRASGSGTLSLPGGKIENGETAMEALAREVREEFGMVIVEPRPLFKQDAYYFDERKQQGYHATAEYFRCRVECDNQGPVIKGQPEVDQPIWQPLQHIDPLAFHVSGRESIQKFLALIT